MEFIECCRLTNNPERVKQTEMKRTDIFDSLDNVIGNHMDGSATDRDVLDIAVRVNKYLLENPHPHDLVDAAQQSQQPSNVEGLESRLHSVLLKHRDSGEASVSRAVRLVMNELKASQLSGEWVSVDDRLPEKEGRYVIWDRTDAEVVLYFNGEWKSLDRVKQEGPFRFRATYKPSHWMEIHSPTPPKEKG